MIVVARGSALRYPGGEHAFSPQARHPEYRYDATSPDANDVYALVRDLLERSGLDAAARGTPAWNPLGAFIRPRDRVFVLCNFVYHRRPVETDEAFHAKVIHGSVLRALIDYVLIATGRNGSVAFGNAPLQSCHWDEVLRDTGAGAVLDFYRRQGEPVEAVDLRGEITERDALGHVTRRTVRSDAPAIEVDLAAASLLDRIPGSTGQSHFRVSDYDPDRTEAFHREGSHRYVIHRRVLESDVVISLPKLKTHEKVGITCAVKGFVGAVARKDCLAHHRYADPRRGGDEYPASFAALRPLSRYHDWVNRRGDGATGQALFQVLDRNVRRGLRRLGVPGAGAWHGNDTAWRMAVDLARILHYADAGGRLQRERQRRHLALIDGVVAGEGNGPLAPTAARAGVLIFADGVLDADRAAARLMGFDPDAIPMIVGGAEPSPWPLDLDGAPSAFALLDGGRIAVDSLPQAIGRPFRTPDGWRGRLEVAT